VGRGLPAGALLRLPVQVRGIHVARPVDVLVDVERLRALGLAVRCLDEVVRFLPLGAARIRPHSIEIASPLVLLEEDRFYRERGRRLDSLRGSRVSRRPTELGTLVDVVIGLGGEIEELLVEGPQGLEEVVVTEDVRLHAARRAA
jgi:hypothetical protein